MNQTARILALFIALSTLITPAHAIEIRTWKCLTGLGAIGGAIIGAAIYKKHHNSRKNHVPKQDPLEQEETNQSRALTIGATIGSACIGAAATALAIGAWFYQFRPDARLAKAHALIRSAGDDNYIHAFIGEGLDNPNRTIEEKACTYFRRYPLVYAEQSMHRGEQKLVAADTLCLQATEDASGDAVLVRDCDQARQQAGQLANSARDFGRDIRMHPRYRTEVADEGREQIAQRHAEAAERTARAAEIRALTPRVTVVNNIASNRNTYGENGIRSKQ